MFKKMMVVLAMALVLITSNVFAQDYVNQTQIQQSYGSYDSYYQQQYFTNGGTLSGYASTPGAFSYATGSVSGSGSVVIKGFTGTFTKPGYNGSISFSSSSATVRK